MVQAISTLGQLPTFNISVNGNKLKVYPDNKYYLKGGTHFELFFENMTQFNYKAEISFNGVKEQSALVLRPGQKFVLERFMNVDKKLLFDVYEVDDTPAAKAAIAKNGWISVSFFKEKQTIPTNYYLSVNNSSTPSWKYLDVKYSNSTAEYSASSIRGRSMSKSVKNFTEDMSLGMDLERSVETGRVEKGGDSNQSFRYVNMEFEYNPDNTITYQILPESYIPIAVVKPSQIRNYCPNCGMRIKQGWNGCPKCVIEL